MSDVLQFASPERRRLDNSFLPVIPTEIYFEIFDYFVPSPEDLSESESHSILANLSLVCSFFHAICVPRIFETITMTGKAHVTRRHWYRRVSKNHPHALSLAAYVKTCRLSAWRPPVSATVNSYSAQSAQLAEVISRFRNLESLSLTHTPITQPFFLSVIVKDSLKSVSITNCQFHPIEREWDLDRFQSRWSSISVKGNGANMSMMPYETPLSILASSGNLQTCIIDDDSLANAIFSRPVEFDHLRYLRVGRPTALESFLNRTPSITALHWLPRRTKPDHALSYNSLPSIEVLSCGISNDRLLQDLIARPSLQKIILYPMGLEDPDAKKLVWKSLQRASSNVKALRIPTNIYDFGPLSVKFPVLDELEVKCLEASTSSLQALCTQWSNHPQVRLLILDLGHSHWLNLRDQHYALVNYVSKAFPQTKKVRIKPHFEWSKIGSRWKIEVIHRRELKNLMWDIRKTRPEDVEDFEGALLGIFNEKERAWPWFRSFLKLDEFIPAT